MQPAETSDATVRKLPKVVEEFQTYIERNAGFIPNSGERWRHGERISTAFVESTVNQVVSKRMVKRQQMRWSPRGTHLRRQVLTRVLNEGGYAAPSAIGMSGLTQAPEREQSPRLPELPHFFPVAKIRDGELLA